MTEPILIAMVGKKNAGKTTVAEYLQEKGFAEVVFAEPVKRVTEIVFGFDYDMLLGNTPEKRELRNTLCDPIWNLTPVQAMQQLGTELFRDHFDEDVWIKIAGRKIDALLNRGQSVVVSDARFENEIEFIRAKGGHIIVVYEDINDIEIPTQEYLDKTKGTPQGHASEVSFQKAINREKDILIHNNKHINQDIAKSKSVLYREIDYALKNL